MLTDTRDRPAATSGSRRFASRRADLQLLRIGRGAGRQSRAGSGAHRLGLALAGAAVLMLLWVLLAGTLASGARQDRALARSPVQPPQPTATSGRWFERIDTLDQRAYSVVFLEPPGTGNLRPPPGLPGWPAPGQAFLSPALRHAARGALDSRYGAVVGEIGAAGLVDPGEWLVYLRSPSSTSLGELDRPTALTGFGTGGTYPFGSQQTDRAPADLFVALLGFLGLPTAVLIVLAARSQADARDRRLALLESLGARRRARGLVVLGEAALPISVGVLAAAAAAVATAALGLHLPVVGYSLAGSDLRPGLVALPALAIAAFLVVAATTVALHLSSRSTAGNRPRTLGAPLGRKRLWLFAASVATAALGVSLEGLDGGNLFLVGLIATLATTPLVAGHLSALLGGRIAGWGRRRGRVPALVGGRWLAARPAVVARLGAALAVTLGLLAQVQLLVSEYTSTERDAIAVSRTTGRDVVTIQTTRVTPQTEAAFRAALPADAAVFVVTEPATGETVLSGPCPQLQQLGPLPRCPTSPVALRQAFRQPTERQRALELSLLSPQVVTDARPVVNGNDSRDRGFITLNTSGPAGLNRIKQAAYASLATPIVTEPGEATLVGAHDRSRLVNWLLLLSGTGILLLLAAGATSAASTFVSQARDLGPLAAYTADRRLYLQVAAWNIALPLATTAVVGGVVALLLAGLQLNRLNGGGRFSPGFLGLCVALAVLTALVTALIAGVAAARAADDWAPTGD